MTRPVTVPEWLAALRTGADVKGEGMLLDYAGRMCCLGVLCRVAGVDDMTILDEPTPDEAGVELAGEVDAFLTAEMVDTLATLNDCVYGDDATFDRIADEIERRYNKWREARP